MNKAGKPGEQLITLVEPRRSQNIVIMLSRFKTITFAQVCASFVSPRACVSAAN